MGYDVFVSYSSKNRAVADALVHFLEEEKIKCWIAPRDICGGENYTTAIARGLSVTRITLFIVSAESMKSPWCNNEIAESISHRHAVLPCRIDESEVLPGVKFTLSTSHWLDVFPHPEKSFAKIKHDVCALLGKDGDNQKHGSGTEPNEIKRRHEFYVKMARKYKDNDGVIDAAEHAELDRLAKKLGIDEVTSEELIDSVEESYSHKSKSSRKQTGRDKEVKSDGKPALRKGPEKKSIDSDNVEVVGESFGEHVMGILRRYGGRNFTIGNKIDATKKANACQTMSALPDEQIFALADTTVFGSAKTGLLVTSWGLRWKNDLMTKSRVCEISWRDFSHQKKPSRNGEYDICLSEGAVFGTAGSNGSATSLYEAICELHQFVQGSVVKEQGDGPSQETFTLFLIREIMGMDENSFCCGNDIPAKKLMAARKYYPVKQDEQILALIDTSWFGSCKTGLVLTEKGFCWNNESLATKLRRCEWLHYAKWPDPIVDSHKITFGPGAKYDNCGGSVAEESVVKVMLAVKSWLAVNS